MLGPLVAIGLLSTGISHDYAWRIMLALGAIPGSAVGLAVGEGRGTRPPAA